MCGRYQITSAPEAIRALFRYKEQPNFPPRYNVAPTQPIPIVRLMEGERHFALVRWGLIPSWVKDPRNYSLIINARGESVLDKPAFKYAMRRRRCLVPADGFYEWKAGGARKQPYAVVPAQGGPIAFAGLWETWTGPNGEELETAAIVTTAANRALRNIHDRVPAVIMPEQYDLWLDPNADVRMALELIAPPPEDFFRAYEISTAVNRVANDTPDLLTPAAEAAPAEQVQHPAHAAPQRAARGRAKADSGQGSLF